VEDRNTTGGDEENFTAGGENARFREKKFLGRGIIWVHRPPGIMKYKQRIMEGKLAGGTRGQKLKKDSKSDKKKSFVTGWRRGRRKGGEGTPWLKKREKKIKSRKTISKRQIAPSCSDTKRGVKQLKHEGEDKDLHAIFCMGKDECLGS